MNSKLQKFISSILAAVIFATAFAPITQASEVQFSSSLTLSTSVESSTPSKSAFTPILYGVWLVVVYDEYTDVHLWYKFLPTPPSFQNNGNGNSQPNSFNIGNANNVSSQIYFTSGIIDDVGVFSRALTDNEIAGLEEMGT